MLEEFRQSLNTWGKARTPFLFILDFELKKPIALPLDRVDPKECLFDFEGVTNTSGQPLANVPVEMFKDPISFEEYQQKFQQVMSRLCYGDSFLVNLTLRTPVRLSVSTKELFHRTTARYKLWLRDEFIFFSPETFVVIQNGTIRTNPMKGTRDAALPQAEHQLLADAKEMAEHITIVDLLRNDVSCVADEVKVNRFRYVERLRTHNGELLQVSSEITGVLPANYSEGLGDIVLALVPAGSVSGAPKTKTLEIIREVEREERGYYAGVAGIFDGEKLNSCVMIRFIEERLGKYWYRSGGGITTQSHAEYEYQEALKKIYVPLV